VNSAAGAAGALAGWAFSSLGKKLASSDLQSTMSSAIGIGIDRPTSAPPPVAGSSTDPRIGNLRPSPLFTTLSAANSTVSSPVVPTRPAQQSKAKGLQLGANKVPPSVAAAALAAQLAEETAAANDISGSNPWGTDDLIDVNADQDDWSAFESAPPLRVEAKHDTVELGFGGIGNTNGNTNGSISHQFDEPWGVTGNSSPWADQTIENPIPSVQTRKVPATIKQTTVSSVVNDWDAAGGWDEPEKKSSSVPAASMSGMTKEDRAAEMARRKEERKQRIAQLKEQKKHAKI